MSIAQSLLPEFDQEMSNTRRCLDRIPTDRLDWKAHEKFDSSVAAARDAIAKASNEEMMAAWTLLKGGQVLFTMPRIAVIRSTIMNHMIHHRGQLTVYLRLNDVPLPALYGPTADEG